MDHGRLLLSLDVALYETVETLAKRIGAGAGEKLLRERLHMAGDGEAQLGLDLGCWKALVAAGRPDVGAVRLTGAQWNAAAAAWLGRQQRAALQGRCGYIGAGSEATGYHSTWRLDPQQLGVAGQLE